ncbi:MAG TPA: sigma-54 dependent transcriptional regulator [Acidobacteriota bacterium]|jgi:two-component system NtrC family response regulator|nr:sigma-54 dependent transcriptional regulator [Acidobacteriota bacterium]
MKIRATVLVVDDEPYVRDSLVSVLRRNRYQVRTADGSEAALQPGTLGGVDAVITDLRMPGQDGLALLRKLSEIEPVMPVIVLTGYGTVPSAVECMKAGAYDYLLKPASPEALLLLLERALSQSTMRRELDYLRSSEGRRADRREPLGISRAWKEVVELVEAAAPTDTSVLLLGESGTGKEEVAQLLHQKSHRSKEPFVRVNCAAVPLDLFESEFFGHRKGAFTGALEDRVGRFRVAHRGTLFMDEINSMPEAAQMKVLRVLQDGVFERVGDSHSTVVDVRLVVASNAELEAEVEAGRFRRDLFYRINVMTIHLPPLRDRVDDIALLSAAFLDEFNTRLQKAIHSLHPETLAILESYHWPGNIRELRNIIERAVLLERTEQLLPSSLPFSMRQERVADALQNLNLRAHLAAEERRLLDEALRRSKGVRRTAAKLLGIDERNLNYFLKKHGLAKEKQA